MIVEFDVAIPASDGAVLRANVFRPAESGTYPVIMAQGAYNKDVHFADQFPAQWKKLNTIYPDIARNGSTGRYLRWEVVDPERWVPDGYVVIQVDSRGSGKSPGYLDPYSPREISDYYDAIEWAGVQPWSTGKVGTIGVSYLAITQWLVAALQPPHLAAIVPWEGASDHYRDWSYHGGILSNTFLEGWYANQLLRNQNGNAQAPWTDQLRDRPVTGDELALDILEQNRSDYIGDLSRHPLCDSWHRERTPDLSRINVPLLSAGNWGGPGVHLRGNIEGWKRAASAQKWLSMHVGTHYESFYLPHYVNLQKRFFDRFLKGIENGFDGEPRVTLVVRHPAVNCLRTDDVFPPADCVSEHLYLSDGFMLAPQAGASSEITFAADGEGVTFSTPPFESDCEYTGYVRANLSARSSALDIDLFAILRVFDPAGEEWIFDGAHEPTPVSRGWLRVSHRGQDSHLSDADRPFLLHTDPEPLVPGQWYNFTIELWPTSIVVPKGFRLAITLMGRDFELPGIGGRIRHSHPQDRSASLTAHYTLGVGGEHRSCLLMPKCNGRQIETKTN